MSTNEDTIAAAEQAVNGAREVVAARAGERDALQAEVTRLQARLAELAPPAPVTPAPAKPAPAPTGTPDVSALLSEYAAHKARERNEVRLSALRAMGLAAPLEDSQILALAPDVDPRAPEGAQAFESFRQANSRLFRPAADPIEVSLRAELAPLEAKNGGLFRADRLIANADRLAVAPPAPRQAPAFDVAAVRAEAAAKHAPGGLFNGARLAASFLGEPE